MARNQPSSRQAPSGQPHSPAPSTADVVEQAEATPEVVKHPPLFEIPSMLNPKTYIGLDPVSGDFVFTKQRASVDEPARSSISTIVSNYPGFDADFRVTLPLRVGNSAGLILPFGLTALSGPTKAGKSSLIRAINRATSGGVMRAVAVEPFDDDEEILSSQHVYNSVDSAIWALLRARIEDGKNFIPVVDSLREALYEITGPAGTKGVINPFFTALTRVSNALAELRISIVAVINPMADDEGYIAEFKTKLSSALPATLWLDRYTGTEEEGRFRSSGVVEMRPNRKPMAFAYDSADTLSARAAREDLVGMELVSASSDPVARSFAETSAIDSLTKF